MSLQRLLIIGGTGLLGTAFRAAATERGLSCVWTSRSGQSGGERLDVLDAAAVRRTISDTAAGTCLHLAALPDPAYCEAHPQEAAAINAGGTTHVAEACIELGVHLMYASTDYVFDGQRETYVEDDKPNPLQTYGATKLQGERDVRALFGGGALIVRYPLLYRPDGAPGRATFPQVTVAALQAGKLVSCDDTEWRQPTRTDDAAAITLELLARQVVGTVHVAAQEGVTKYSWARQLADQVAAPGSVVVEARRPRASPQRPKRSWLAVERLRALGIRAPRGWREELTS